MSRPRELGKPATGQLKTGLHLLSGTPAKGSLIYVPQTLGDTPAPLVVMMHGASGTAEGGMAYMQDLADEVSTSTTAVALACMCYRLVHKLLPVLLAKEHNWC